MERNTSNIRRMAFECEDCRRIAILDVVEFDGVMACRGEPSLVRRYCQSIHLGIRVGDGAGADAAESFPESVEYGVSLRRQFGIRRVPRMC